MAIIKQTTIKKYVRTTAQVKTAIGAGAGETLQAPWLGDGITFVTIEGTAPVIERVYSISLPEGRALLGMVDSEQFSAVELGTDVTITTRLQTI